MILACIKVSTEYFPVFLQENYLRVALPVRCRATNATHNDTELPNKGIIVGTKTGISNSRFSSGKRNELWHNMYC